MEYKDKKNKEDKIENEVLHHFSFPPLHYFSLQKYKFGVKPLDTLHDINQYTPCQTILMPKAKEKSILLIISLLKILIFYS
jgi:hypothetical protein